MDGDTEISLLYGVKKIGFLFCDEDEFQMD